MKKPPALLHHLEKWVDNYMACRPRPMPSMARLRKACIVAHRGAHDASLQIIENTHAAFRRSIELGCYGIELDIHACKDNMLVVNHDPTLNRLWGRDVAIHSLEFETLKQIVPAIPLFSDVVKEYGKKIHLFVEVKTPFLPIEALLADLSPLTPCLDYHLISLDASILPRLATFFPKEALVLIPIHNNVRTYCKLSIEHCYGGILGHYLLLTKQQIKQLAMANQLAGVGFVDSKFSLYRELNRGLQYLFSNNVSTITNLLSAFDYPEEPLIP